MTTTDTLVGTSDDTAATPAAPNYVAELFDAITAAEQAVNANQAARDAYTRALADSTLTPNQQDTVRLRHAQSETDRKAAVTHAGVVYSLISDRIDDGARADAAARLRNIPGVDLAIFADPDTDAAYMAQQAADGWPILARTDIEAILAGEWEAPRPTLLTRTDGAGLLYAGKVHSLAGEPGGGKTWVALHAIAQVIANGGIGILIDFEDRPDTAVRRLAALDVPHTDIVARFRYISPTFAIRGGGLPANVVDLSAGATLVVLDSAGEALAHSQLNQNDDGEVRNWFDATARRLAHGGAAVLVLDHVTKDAEGRGRWAIGSQRKLAAIDGMAMVATTVAAASKTSEGRYVVKCAKDRGGNYLHGSTVADITITPIGDGVHITIAPPSDITNDDGERMLTHLFGDIAALLDGIEDGLSGRAITGSIKGKAETVRKALGQMVDLGYLSVVAHGSARIYTLIRPYNGAGEVSERLGDATSASVRPTASHDPGTHTEDDRVRASHPLGGDAPDAVSGDASKTHPISAPRPTGSGEVDTPPAATPKPTLPPDVPRPWGPPADSS